MAVENVTYISSLDPTAPAGGDSISEGDDHIRNIKKALTGSFPNVDGPVELTTEEFAKLKSGLRNGGTVASCKYNGSSIKYQDGISSVNQFSDGNYRVTFDADIAGFDEHYAPVITPFISPRNRPCVVSLQGFTATELTFSLVELVGDGSHAAAKDTGFSLLIVDMIQS
jgi:hypothetical protein